MTHDQPNLAPVDRFAWRPGRLEAFSDGVFAIAITLLVLDIGVEQAGDSDPLAAVLSLWPQYLAYLVSFATIGAVWIGHTAITHHLDHVDPFLVRTNLMLLLTVSFLPFPTRLLGELLSRESGQRVATVVLGANLLLAALLLSVLWRAAVRRGLVRPDADDREVSFLTRRLTPGLAGYAAFIAVGFLFPLAAVVGYLLVAIALIVPRRHGPAEAVQKTR